MVYASEHGRLGSLPMLEGTLDFAVSTLSLHHWSDPSQGLAEFHRVLKPGGQFLVFDLRRDSWHFFYWLLRFAQRCVVPNALRGVNEPLGSLLSSYTLAEVENLLTLSPFTEWRIEGGPAWVFAWAGKRP
jgi:ubiquinone/menaquinone biosynthesis C-methylase UbiE